MIKAREKERSTKEKRNDKDKVDLCPLPLPCLAEVLIITSTALLHSLAQTQVRSTRAPLSESHPALSKPNSEDQPSKPIMPKNKTTLNQIIIMGSHQAV